ncbi:hypothetical protein [Streptomyces sp. NBC_00470]|uniref:hypothetical protein n=1 Tax=Streptomyces sp. NBC_00470 TaxID=2975753 RepID=UPI003250B6F6
MAREIQITCDVCLEEGRKTPAGVIAFAVRSVDPDGKVRVLEGAVEQCAEHAGPLGALAFGEELPQMVRPLEGEERAELLSQPKKVATVSAVNAVSALGPRDYVLCRTCIPAKPLKKSSMNVHAQGVHKGAAVSSLEWAVAQPGETL